MAQFKRVERFKVAINIVLRELTIRIGMARQNVKKSRCEVVDKKEEENFV